MKLSRIGERIAILRRNYAHSSRVGIQFGILLCFVSVGLFQVARVTEGWVLFAAGISGGFVGIYGAFLTVVHLALGSAAWHQQERGDERQRIALLEEIIDDKWPRTRRSTDVERDA